MNQMKILDYWHIWGRSKFCSWWIKITIVLKYSSTFYNIQYSPIFTVAIMKLVAENINPSRDNKDGRKTLKWIPKTSSLSTCTSFV